MPARAALFALLLVALASSGCTTPSQASKEFREAFHVGVGFSPRPAGMLWINLPVFSLNLGWIGDSAWVGNDYGYTSGWYQIGYGLIARGGIQRSEFGHPIGGLTLGAERRAYLDQTQYVLVNVIRADHRFESRPGSVPVTRFDFGLHLLFVGFSFGLDPLQLFDALFGLAGIDLLWDDHDLPLRAFFD